MSVNRQPEIFSTIIPLKTRVEAEEFRRYQSQPSKGKQVYLNTLAVSVVNLYLNSLGWSTNLSASDSQNPVFQTMMDIADLEIPDYGKIECRFVMVGDRTVTIPPEVWTARIGYIVVQLNKSLDRADILGFVRQVSQTQLPLNRLESLEQFPAYLSSQKRLVSTPIIKLGNWFARQPDPNWQHLEELFAPSVALNFRSPEKSADTDQLSSAVNRVKLVKLGENINIALVLNIQLNSNFALETLLNQEKSNKTSLENLPENISSTSDFRSDVSSSQQDILPTQPEFNISMTVCNSQFDNFLPPGLELAILDRDSHPVMVAQANQTKTIEFCFSGNLGESFSVEMAIGEKIQIESFII